MSKQIFNYYIAKPVKDVVKEMDFKINVSNKVDKKETFEKGLRFVKKKNNKYYVYYRYRKSMSSFNRFGFNDDEVYFKYNYFILDIHSITENECEIELQVIEDTKKWNYIKLFLVAPLFSLLILSGILYLLNDFKISVPNSLVYLGSTLITYSATFLNIVFNKEDIEDFEKNAISLLKKTIPMLNI